MAIREEQSAFKEAVFNVCRKSCGNVAIIQNSLAVRSKLNNEPSNEVPSFRTGGDGKGVRGIGGETDQLARLQYAINIIAI